MIGIGLSPWPVGGKGHGGGGGGPQLKLTGRTVAENASVGALVGTLSVVGSHTGTPAYTLDSSAGGRFALDGAGVEVAGALDYETDTFHTITVSVADTTPDTPTRNFIIFVTDVAEGGAAPTMNFSIAANSQLLAVLDDF